MKIYQTLLRESRKGGIRGAIGLALLFLFLVITVVVVGIITILVILRNIPPRQPPDNQQDIAAFVSQFQSPGSNVMVVALPRMVVAITNATAAITVGVQSSTNLIDWVQEPMAPMAVGDYTDSALLTSVWSAATNGSAAPFKFYRAVICR
jgi:hypothetical protein